MKCRSGAAIPLLIAFLLAGGTLRSQIFSLEGPPHFYDTAEPADEFSQKVRDWEKTGAFPTGETERDYLISLLKKLGIPAETQTLLFSATSLQLSRITPRNPRALYFSDDTYVGYIPGGKLEVVSIDPALGGIFSIFPFPRANSAPVVTRSDQCLNCHTNEDTGYVPGIVLMSVIRGPNGGSLNSFRRDEIGHHVPLNQRFGGWYLTGMAPPPGSWANQMGKPARGGPIRVDLPPGTLYDPHTFPAPASDILAHLLLEHQAGFVNRFLRATWRTRELAARPEGLDETARAELKILAEELVRYTLFTDEAALPEGGITGDPALVNAFEARGPTRKLNLKTRLLETPVSYMLQSAAARGLPTPMRTELIRTLWETLDSPAPHPLTPGLSTETKQRIIALIRSEMPEWLPEPHAKAITSDPARSPDTSSPGIPSPAAAPPDTTAG